MPKQTISQTDSLAIAAKKFTLANKLTFLLPSLLGLVLFVIPIPYEESFTIAVGILAGFLQKSLLFWLPRLIVAVVALSFVASLMVTYGFKDSGEGQQANMWLRLFKLSPFWLLVRGLAAVFAIMAFWQIGLAAIASDKTGGLLLHELLPTIFCMFLIAGFLLPLLLDFGLLEFVGVLASKVMRPVFTLPGRASVDCLASWLGDGTIGILLTNLQYIEGHYSEREASIIATTFSFVSLSFSIVILAQLRLMPYIFPFYLSVGIVGLTCAVILPRIPPLSRKKDNYYTKTPDEDTQHVPVSTTAWRWAVYCAFVRASKQRGIGSFLRGGITNVVEMWAGVIPVVMAFGTIALMLAEFTPLFQWLGMPFVPLLEILRIPQAEQLSQAVVIGFADMFLPAVLASSLTEELPRFVVAAVSVSQLIFMSEVGGLILGSKIPVNFKDLLSLFVLRTLIALPIVAAISHIIF